MSFGYCLLLWLYNIWEKETNEKDDEQNDGEFLTQSPDYQSLHQTKNETCKAAGVVDIEFKNKLTLTNTYFIIQDVLTVVSIFHWKLSQQTLQTISYDSFVWYLLGDFVM